MHQHVQRHVVPVRQPAPRPRLLNHHLPQSAPSPRPAPVRQPRPPRAPRPSNRNADNQTRPPPLPRAAQRPQRPQIRLSLQEEIRAPECPILRNPDPVAQIRQPPPPPPQQSFKIATGPSGFLIRQTPILPEKTIPMRSSGPSDLDDLEESIAAAVVQKNPTANRQQNLIDPQHFQQSQGQPSPAQQAPRQPGVQHQLYSPQQQQFGGTQHYQQQQQRHPQNVYNDSELFNEQQGHHQMGYEPQPGNLYSDQADDPSRQGDPVRLQMRNPSPVHNRGGARGGRGGAVGRQTFMPRKQDQLNNSPIPVQVVSPLRHPQEQQEGSSGGMENGVASVVEPMSARMLIMLESGEQRLITFTLPKESCTVEELLEQVNVPFTADTPIQCTTQLGPEIDYVVAVGSPTKMEGMIQNYQLAMESLTRRNQGSAAESDSPGGSCQNSAESSPEKVVLPPLPPQPPPALPPQPPPSPPPRYIKGMVAVCKCCGYTGYDFAKCQRCKRKFPEEPKAIPIEDNKKLEKKEPEKPPTPIKENPTTMAIEPLKLNLLKPGLKVLKGNINEKKPRARKGRSKQPDPEPVILTLSSDEEDSNSSIQNTQASGELMSSLLASGADPTVTMSASLKEPTLQDLETTPGSALHPNSIPPHSDLFQDREEINEPAEGANDGICIVLDCRTIRIGSHKYTPREKVLISSKGIRMVAPIIEGDGEEKEAVLQLQSRELVKVLIHSGKALPVLFLYTMQSCGAYVRKSLHMTDSNGPYYNPVAKEEQLKRITLLPYAITDETKNNLKHIFGACIDDLSPREANDILIRTCPRELQMTAKMMTRASSNLSAGKKVCYFFVKMISSAGGIRQILIYPPGKGGISINTEDYMCLAQDQFLNDVIIDFYLSYLCQDILTPSQRDKTHVFSTFFYKRMSNAYESDAMLTPAQKRHARVKSWTKNVNIFHRDYVVIPINENCHWFLAIICFPGLDSCRSFLSDKPVVPQEMKKKDRKSMLQIGNTTITPMMKQEQMGLNYNDGDNLSERDEAEADESDLDMLGSESDNDESEPKSRMENKDSDDSSASNNRAKEAIKQPCILIFDSLAGASRSRVVATLRDYLTCEYHAKISPDKKFTKDNIKGSCPKIPQQNNFTDCGLYLLQYVEHFFKHPVTDYQLPIKQLANWFDEIVVTRKREEISNLLKNLMINNNVEIETLPDISFPTLNGKLIESSEHENGDITDQQSSSGTPPKEKDSGDSSNPLMPKLTDATGNGDEDPASVRKTLRLSSETVVAPKHSDIVKDIQNSLIKNKVNQDKGATANNSFNILVSASSDPEGGLSQVVLKNRRSSKNDDDASDSKKIKLNQQN